MNKMLSKSNYYQYSGAIHIHTKFSDGTGNIESISKAAKEAGLDWIIITDHNSFEIEEGIYHGVYVIKGEEISPKSSNHYLALGISNEIEPSEDPQTNVDNVRMQGGFGFAAHPDESGERQNKWKPIIWENKNVIPDGIEIWNWFSNWGDNLNDRNIFKLIYSYFNKNAIVTAPVSATLDWWDYLNKKSEKIVPAIGGVDAHAMKFYRYILPVTIFPYKTCFKTITNVITTTEPLSKAFDVAKWQILKAIKQGNNLIVNRKVCNDIPQISISNSKCTKAIGETITLTEDTFINIQLHEIADVKIMLDGVDYSEHKIKRCRIPVMETGRYRIELTYQGKGFAYTNPIQVVKG